MKIRFLIVLLFSCLVKSYSQTSSPTKIDSRHVTLSAAEEKAFSQLIGFELLNIDMSKITEVLSDTNKVVFEIQIDLAKGTKNSLTLFRNNILSENLIKERKKQKDAQKDLYIFTFSGYNNSKIDNKVRLTLTQNGISGYIENGDETYFLERTTNLGFQTLKNKGNLVVHKGTDSAIDTTTCGVDDTSPAISSIAAIDNQLFSSGSLTVTDNCYVLSLATDADYEFYQYYGSQSNNEILSIVNMIDGIYETSYNLTIIVVYQHVWTSSNDPYSGDPLSLSGSDLLVYELEQYWNTNMGSINRDLVHLFTGKRANVSSGSNGQVSQIGSVCSTPNKSYGYSKIRGNQFLTTAHEIAHNLGAIHSDAVNCTGTAGSIMCTGDTKSPSMYFSNASLARVSNYIMSNSSCLTGNVAISGPTLICSAGTFTATGGPSGSLVWNVSPTHLFTGATSGTGSTAVINRASGTSGKAIIKFESDGFCGSKTIWVGNPQLAISGPYEMAYNTVENYYAISGGYPYNANDLSLMGITNYSWSVYPAGYHWIGNQGTPGITLTISNTGIYSLELDATNPCGVSGVETSVWVYDPLSMFVVYPNPSSSILKVSKKSTLTSVQVDQSPFDAQIFNGQGENVATPSFDGNDIVFDVSNLKPGFYFLHIHYKGETIKRQIKVE